MTINVQVCVQGIVNFLGKTVFFPLIATDLHGEVFQVGFNDFWFSSSGNSQYCCGTEKKKSKDDDEIFIIVHKDFFLEIEGIARKFFKAEISAAGLFMLFSHSFQ